MPAAIRAAGPSPPARSAAHRQPGLSLHEGHRRGAPWPGDCDAGVGDSWRMGLSHEGKRSRIAAVGAERDPAAPGPDLTQPATRASESTAEAEPPGRADGCLPLPPTHPAAPHRVHSLTYPEEHIGSKEQVFGAAADLGALEVLGFACWHGGHGGAWAMPGRLTAPCRPPACCRAVPACLPPVQQLPLRPLEPAP